MQTSILLADIETYVTEVFCTYVNPSLLYHNLDHTKQVVGHVEEIAAWYSLDEVNRFIVIAAAWFHDIGHLLGEMENHEETGILLMELYFKHKEVNEEIRKKIAACILSTKMPARPVTLIEQILCDADTYHLGTTDFRRVDALVWAEQELRTGKMVAGKANRSLHFMEAHNYYTEYCQQLLNKKKQDNLNQLRNEVMHSGW